MNVKSGQAVTTGFTVHLPSTGAVTNADSLPTGTLYVNGTADAATVTVTNITTGRYKAAVTLPTLAAGDTVEIHIAGTVGGVTSGGYVWKAIADTVRLSDSTPQTGDSYARIGAAGAGLTAVGDTRLANLDAAVSGRSSAADLAVVAGYIDTEIAAIKAKTDNLPADPADQSAVEAAIAALNDVSVADIWSGVTQAAANFIADHVLRRGAATVEGSENGDALGVHSLLGLIRAKLNSTIAGGTWTIRKGDGSTLGTRTVTSSAGADPVTGVE